MALLIWRFIGTPHEPAEGMYAAGSGRNDQMPLRWWKPQLTPEER